MNASIQGIIDHMFRDTVDNMETRALHEELLNNCLDHYEDLVSRGMSETEAIDAVVESLKGMKEVIDEYPKKPGTVMQPDVQQENDKTPEIRANEPEKNVPPEEKPSEYVFDSAEIRRLKTDLKNCDLKIGVSNDGKIHVRCEDMEQLVCEQNGQVLSVTIVDKARKTIEEAGRAMNGQEFSMKGLLNFIGKAIGSVSASITVSWDVYIDLPEKVLAEMELSTKSGDIEVKAKMPEVLTARSMSGDVRVDALDSDPAGKVTLSAMSGEVEFEGNADIIILSSMSGDVQARGIYRNVEMKSTSGDVELEGEGEQIRMNSVSGDVTIDLENMTARSIQARSTSGDVDIDLAAGTDSVHCSASTVSGSVHNSIPDAGSVAKLQIQANSVSGDVTVR